MKATKVLIQRPVEMKPVPGYEGLYSISWTGRVWAHQRITKHNSAKGYQARKGKWLRWNPSGQGAYPAVWLYDLSGENKHGRMHYIHHLVMAVWGPPQPSPEHEINHKDLDKWNNHRSNLEWTTSRGNTQHAIAHGHYSPPPIARGSANVRASLTEAEVLEIRRRYTGKQGEQTTLARDFNVSRNQINLIVRRRAWQHI